MNTTSLEPVLPKSEMCRRTPANQEFRICYYVPEIIVSHNGSEPLPYVAERYVYVCAGPDDAWYFAIRADGGLIGSYKTYADAWTAAARYAQQFYALQADAMIVAQQICAKSPRQS